MVAKNQTIEANKYIIISFLLFGKIKKDETKNSDKVIALLSLNPKNIMAMIGAINLFLPNRKKYINNTRNSPAVGSGCQSVTKGFSIPA